MQDTLMNNSKSGKLKFGISAALSIPFKPTNELDLDLLCEHANNMIEQGCDSITLFGTTGEGPSITAAERLDTLRLLLKDISPQQLAFSVYGPAARDVGSQVNAALELGIDCFLLPPPFYYKNLDDAGLRNWHDEVFAHCGSDASFFLYNIPQVTGVTFSPDWVAQTNAAHPNRLRGVKDSSGAVDSARNFIEANSDLQILVGDERILHATGPMGVQGSITGVANFADPGILRDLLLSGEKNQKLNDLVDAVVALPATPAVKSLVAHTYQNEAWRHTMPPLAPIGDEDHVKLGQALAEFMSS